MFNNEHNELLIGLIRHFSIASDTSKPKTIRLKSLDILQEVLEYLIPNLNTELPQVAEIYSRVFPATLNKIVKAKVLIHTEPLSFQDEIGFLRIILNN